MVHHIEHIGFSTIIKCVFEKDFEFEIQKNNLKITGILFKFFNNYGIPSTNFLFVRR